jgi:type IV secretory pathway VirB10-like protein
VQENSKLELRTMPVQTVQVNKPVVLSIVAVVFLAILLAVIHAFNVTENVKVAGGGNNAIKVNTDKPVLISNELNGLPNSYTDVDAIHKYLPGGGQAEEIAKLQQQLSSLKDAYELLEEQVRANSQNSTGHRVINPDDDKAKVSDMGFPGLTSIEGNAEHLISGGGGDRGDNPFGSKIKGNDNKQQDLVATKQQADYYEKEGENKQRLAAISAAVDNAKIKKIIDPEGGFYKLVSKYQLQGGTIIQSSLITGIDTSQAGTIVAQIRQNVYDTVHGKYLLIPKGSKLLGEYDSRHIAYGQRRIAMWFNRIVLPNGNSILLGQPKGADLLGQAGVLGNVDNHWARIIGAATISTLLSIGAAVYGNQNANLANNQVSTKQSAAAGAANSFSEVGQQLTGKAMGIPPTITVDPGYQFTVTVNKDLLLEAYKPRY